MGHVSGGRGMIELMDPATEADLNRWLAINSSDTGANLRGAMIETYEAAPEHYSWCLDRWWEVLQDTLGEETPQ
jgi:hypothetical protein